MDTDKPTKTLADYLVIVVSPVLIMVLVHSLCFFLVEVFYRGEAAGGVRWVLFWFVLAVVLIARIGIEQGDTHAMIYGIFLALATWIYLATVQPNAIFGAILLGVVWFTAHKITCNCTLIDDEADASGQGLLQSLRRLPPLFKKKQTPAAVAEPKAKSASASDRAKQKTAAPTPGVWLIYYSLAALPIFGLGQTLLPAERSRRAAPGLRPSFSLSLRRAGVADNDEFSRLAPLSAPALSHDVWKHRVWLGSIWRHGRRRRLGPLFVIAATGSR